MTCFKNTFLKPDIGKSWVDEEGMKSLTDNDEEVSSSPSSQFWDERYGTEELIYGEKPNVFFAKAIKELDPGIVLLPGEGEGRNAIFAAGLGWEVHAIDSSAIAQGKALAWAERKGLPIHYHLKNLMDIELKDNYFDAIGLIYVHLPSYIRRVWHRKILKSLKKGGILILEGFDKSQLGLSSGGPSDESMLFSLEELKKDFELLDLQYSEFLEEHLEEGKGHHGNARIIRLLGRKV
jgi:2-polyprenyl-3-methyl-5-hydroxy-6-metoxy-1,4-benzoquinol methylase